MKLGVSIPAKSVNFLPKLRVAEHIIVTSETAVVDPNEPFDTAMPSQDHPTARKIRVGNIVIGFKRLTDISDFTTVENVLLNLIWKVREVGDEPRRIPYSALGSGIIGYGGGSERDHRQKDL